MIRLFKWLFLIGKVRKDERIRQTFAAMRTLSWPQRASLVAAVARDPRLPWRVRFAPFLAAAYLASPLDLVPDFIPFFGELDDIAVIGLVLRFMQRSLPPGLLDEHLRRVRDGAGTSS
ncbi:MAG: DUF1232 domain-containing protein [Chloroflexi bacterium]|nr:MAG: DUF1232 domain-containing protein [Chloroflexota bacterium]